MYTPCRDCNKRTEICHIDCQSYRIYKETMDEAALSRHKDMEEHTYSETHVRQIRRKLLKSRQGHK